MARTPPESLIELVHEKIFDLLQDNPAATSSEAYVRSHMEFAVINADVSPKYYLRIGINYHGQKVQQLRTDENTGILVGWNPGGDALGTGSRAKVLLAGHTIFDRDPDEPMMNDSKIGGGDIPDGSYIRIEFKARGWLGQTKNLDGNQLEKDIDLLKEDKADLMVVCLSETAHRKWRGEGPAHQSTRRTGVERFRNILIPIEELEGTEISQRSIDFEGQKWRISTQRTIGSNHSTMPGAEHFVTLCWRL